MEMVEIFLEKYRTQGIDSITEDDLVSVLDAEDFSKIFGLADEIRKRSFGDIIDIRAILEFSNYCRRSCRYCGLNRGNKAVQRYRMDVAEMVEAVTQAAEAGYRTIVLQSGEDSFYTRELLCDIVKKIKERTDIAITLSCGEREPEDYEAFAEAGADRYLLKHETADEEIYRQLHPCGTLENRVRCLQKIQSVGFETGSGFMIGLPNQTSRTIAKDILLLKEIGCDMAGIGPFIPSPGTDLSEHPAGSIELTKRAVALTRLLLPQANLPATTALGVLSSDAKNSIFSCGANVIMRKVTPQKYEEHYSIYPNRIQVKDIVAERTDLEEMIRALGREPR